MSQAPPPEKTHAVTDEPPKRAYHAPELREVGSMVDLTQAGSNVGGDNVYTS
jgi:hypothetical protein